MFLFDVVHNVVVLFFFYLMYRGPSLLDVMQARVDLERFCFKMINLHKVYMK